MDEPTDLPTEPMITTRAEFSRLLKTNGIKQKVRLGGIHEDRFDYYVHKNGFPKSLRTLEKLCSAAGIDLNRLDLDQLVAPKYRSRFGLSLVKPQAKPTYEIQPERQIISTEVPGYVIKNDGVIIGSSTQMHKVFGLLDRITSNPDQETAILIQGETGTGKELIARAIHYNGTRGNKPFKPINITNVQETLLESELFGHKKGAFTGASDEKEGFFEKVSNGTLFLDEIGSLSIDLQAKLLRVLQEKQFYKVGGTELVNFEGRVVTATKEDLEKLLKEDKFRDDLFYRLNVVQVNLPPLRKREEDSLLLFKYFVEQHNKRYGTGFKTDPTKEGEEFLRTYEFPGNVRELENIIKRTIFNSKDEYLRIEYEKRIQEEEELPFLSEELDFIKRVKLSTPKIQELSPIERNQIEFVLRSLYTYACEAYTTARMIGMGKSTMFRQLKKLGITTEKLRQIYGDTKN